MIYERVKMCSGHSSGGEKQGAVSSGSVRLQLLPAVQRSGDVRTNKNSRTEHHSNLSPYFQQRTSGMRIYCGARRTPRIELPSSRLSGDDRHVNAAATALSLGATLAAFNMIKLPASQGPFVPSDDITPVGS